MHASAHNEGSITREMLSWTISFLCDGSVRGEIEPRNPMIAWERWILLVQKACADKIAKKAPKDKKSYVSWNFGGVFPRKPRVRWDGCKKSSTPAVDQWMLDSGSMRLDL